MHTHKHSHAVTHMKTKHIIFFYSVLKRKVKIKQNIKNEEFKLNALCFDLLWLGIFRSKVR